MIVATLALAGIFISLYLTLYKIGVIGELSCSIGSCETVNTSKWSRFLGLPVAAWGLLFYLDVFAIASGLPRCTFVAKHELRGIPVFGWGAESAGVVFLDRENRKAAFESYKVAAAAVQEGRRIVVFPEGTRGVDYHLRHFKKGPFVLAIGSQEPIIPTVVYGAREVMGRDSFRVRAGTVHVHFLSPVTTEGRTYDDRATIMKETKLRRLRSKAWRWSNPSRVINGRCCRPRPTCQD